LTTVQVNDVAGCRQNVGESVMGLVEAGRGQMQGAVTTAIRAELRP